MGSRCNCAECNAALLDNVPQCSCEPGCAAFLQAGDTVVATVLLMLLLGVVLGLPTAAAYLLWVAAKTLVSYPLAWFSQ